MVFCPEPATPPLRPPVTTGAAQEYVVPAGTIVAASGVPFTGVTLNVPSLQTLAACAGIAGRSPTMISASRELTDVQEFDTTQW